jgi:hypothetical protein
MFGYPKMTHEGTAKVVSCEAHIGKLMSGGWTNHTGWDWTPYDFILDVYPNGAPPFRTEVRKHFGSSHHPDAGDTLKVRCNPEKHAVEIDVSEDKRFNRKLYHGADERERKKEHDRVLNAPPGTPVPDNYASSDDELAAYLRGNAPADYGASDDPGAAPPAPRR